MENDIFSLSKLVLKKRGFLSASKNFEPERDLERIECVAYGLQSIDSFLSFHEPAAKSHNEGLGSFAGLVSAAGDGIGVCRGRFEDGIGQVGDPFGIETYILFQDRVHEGIADAEDAIEQMRGGVEFGFQRGPIRMDEAYPSRGSIKVRENW